ncbi:UNVERIFIED_CONTAM: hypothetical protein PYX00_005455 [Menopon gallinae]|uniref:Glucosylceramidase n=1 Tax=Menopon gallinae TaxID=328185 RepID=A0AAW2HRD5_9NEOP
MFLTLLLVFAVSAPASSEWSLPCWSQIQGDTFNCMCNARYCDEIELPQELESGNLHVYMSAAAFGRLQPSYTEFGTKRTDEDTLIAIDRNKAGQVILGFGGALTDATSYNLAKLSPQTRQRFFDSYFGKHGSEYSFVRLPIGGTDFSEREYTNADLNIAATGDPDLEELMRLEQEDYNYKIPNLQKILQLNPRIKLIGSAWSAPKWMTYDDVLGHPKIKVEHYQTWAEYHKKFFDLYKEWNITFWGMTTGNEPFTRAFSVAWDADDQMTWIGDNLGPVLNASDHRYLKLLALDDHTTFTLPYMKVLASKKSGAFIDGLATHWYTDKNINVYHILYRHKFPDNLLINTEASICKFEEHFEEKTQWFGAELYASNILEKLTYYTNAWLDWNMAVDKTGGPNNKGNLCLAPIVVNHEKDEFYKGPIFYVMTHFSKFIPPGSKYLQTTVSPSDIFMQAAAFEVIGRAWNLAVVVLNRHVRERKLRICTDKSCAFITVPPRSIISAIANEKSPGKVIPRWGPEKFTLLFRKM